MSILLSGDFHANVNHELEAITKKALIQKYQKKVYNSIQYHIILGDAGFLWPGNYKTDIFNFRVLANRPFPILSVIGNHEPILGMNNLPETDIGIGETVYKINDKPFVAYLKRGKIYSIDGFKMLVLGGALSIDKIYRKPNISWWENEYWSEKEKQDIFRLLETENDFDIVLSHTGPQHINNILCRQWNFNPNKFSDEVAVLNDKIFEKIKFKQWYCGHWHNEGYYYDQERNQSYQYLYKTTTILDSDSC